jgi:flagellar L-ring protein FlgH
VKRRRWTWWVAAGVAPLGLWAGEARAQSSSLYGAPGLRRPLTIADSWTFQAVLEARTVQLHDIITIIVKESAQVTSDGQMQRRKRATFDAVLRDWLELDGLDIHAAPQAQGDPRINGTLNRQYQALGQMMTRDSMQFQVAATVVDIRPNGNLVLEAHKRIENNEEIWEASLSGVVRPDDVLPNNTVLSEDVAEFSVQKRETGHVRDSYRRGWMGRLVDRFYPF